ncbi:Metabotropic GABA-B receptor subtype 2, isoform C [Linnemannia elongata]|nr:Metabotropic GABA-B receptor subtype 2, isoform C [Linnemannia elongata]
MGTPPPTVLPENEPVPSRRVFPYTPMTGANNSLYLTPNVTSREGLVEIKIGLLLPYSLPNNLTQQLTYSGTSAIRLAASEINENHLIPGAYITLVLKDSFNGADPENSGAAQAIFSTVSLLQTEGGVSGVIGDVSSALTVQSALLTSRLDIPQCSYSAGSTQLSSKDDYGYFFRTIPTELMFGRVMMEFVASRGWQKVAVFYTGDELGSQMMDSIALQARKRNITIGYRSAFWEMESGSDIGPGLDALKASGQQIVLVAAVGEPQIRLMTEAVKRGLISKDYVWLTINQVTEPLLGSAGSTLKPSDLNGLFMFDNMLRLHGYQPYEEFLDKWAALNPEEYPYSGKREISSNEAQAYSCMMVMAHGFANAVKGNWTALHLLASGRLGHKLTPTAMNTNYTGPGGPMVLDDMGDVVYGNFILYNFQNGRVVSIGTSYSGAFNLSSPPMYFDGTYNTPSDSAPLRVLNPAFGSAIGVVIIAIAGLSILFSLVTTCIVILYRNSQIIKASSPLFCCLELFGFILLYFSTIMGLDIPTKFVCIARPMTLNIGFVLVVSNIVAKNFRVYRIFHNIYVTKRAIRDSHLLKIVGTLMSVNLAIMTVWFVKTPPKLQQYIMTDSTTYWDCNSQSGESTPYFVVLFIYNVSLLLIATYLAYRNRNVAANYNECREIAFVVYNILLSGCIAMPTVFLPQDQYLTKFFLSNVVLLFGTTVSLMFMFLPKLWKLFAQIERNNQMNRANEGGGTTSDEGSFDGLFKQGPGGWLAAAAGNGGNGGGGSPIGEYGPGARKGSIGTVDESKGDTLKESHIGYMGIKFQNRYMPFLASWCMRRVILYPTDKYFTAFEAGKPETAKTFSYIAAQILSREPGNYILRVVGTGRHIFLLQVKDEDRLLHWHSLFENKQGNTFTSGLNHVFSPSGIPMMLAQNRNESDQTLQATLRGFQSTASSNGGKWGSGRGAKKVSMDDGDSDIGETSGAGYFSGIHSTAYLHDPPVHLHPSHRHTASAYTAATFTASPRGSQDGGEVGNVVGGRPLTMIETSSSYRQMRFGPLDRSPGPSTRDP